MSRDLLQPTCLGKTVLTGVTTYVSVENIENVSHNFPLNPTISSPEVIKSFMLNSAEREIFPAHKC